MVKELIASGKTVEAAVSNGARELGVDVSRVTYEIIEAPKKGFLGFGEAPAKVKICFESGPEDIALDFVKTLIENMGIDAEAEVARDYSGGADRVIKIKGEAAGVLIGHHGDTMDALQSLVNIAANRGADDEGEDEESEGSAKTPYCRISVDIENYRAKREETLRRLARSMASKVQHSHRSITLEPMNPYERRIIHSEIQNIPGVMTRSTGVDDNRKIVIYPTNDAPARSDDRRPRRRREHKDEAQGEGEE